MDTAAPVCIALSAAPLAGKGTVAERLVKEMRLVHISTGDLLRDEIQSGSTLGEEIQRLMQTGRLVDEALVNRLVTKKLESPEVRKAGALLDGYPRTESQAAFLREYIANSNTWIRMDAFMVIDVPDEVLLERGSGRRIDPVTHHVYHIKYAPPPPEIAHRLKIRPDDQPDRQRGRIAIYKENATAIEKVFGDRVAHVDGNQKMQAVYDDFCRALTAKVYDAGCARRKFPDDVPPLLLKHVEQLQQDRRQKSQQGSKASKL